MQTLLCMEEGRESRGYSARQDKRELAGESWEIAQAAILMLPLESQRLKDTCGVRRINYAGSTVVFRHTETTIFDPDSLFLSTHT